MEPTGAARLRTAERASRFTESVIREMTRLLLLHQGARGVNLAQGFPDFPAPDELKAAAKAAIDADENQYAITWGSRPLREAIAWKTARFVTLREPDWSIDEAELRAAFGPRTRAVVVNTPNNPTGKVFDRAELGLIAELCQRWDAVAITDEIYEHLVYEGEHVRLATLPGMRERTVTINGLSKTYSVTGWRLGFAIAPPGLTDAIRKVHDFLTVGAPAPLQAAAVVARRLPDGYYAELLAGYRARRDLMLEILRRTGFEPFTPHGAYYAMADIRPLGAQDDVSFARHLVQDVGVAVVPGSSFYRDPAMGRTKVRFCFAKKLETLERAGELLDGLRPGRV